MLHGALQQFMKDVNWGELDFMIMDLPPGTGDVVITLSQRVKATGAVVVTTPQAVATDDVFKSVSMCRKVGIDILGVVENMSFYVDSAGVRQELFGAGGGAAVAAFAEAPLLGQVPLDPSVREWGDKGAPVVYAAPTGEASKVFATIADRVVDACEAAHAAEEPEPTIDRTGGADLPSAPAGKVRLPVAR